MNHLVNISGLTDGFNHNYSVVCTANGENSTPTTVNVTVNSAGSWSADAPVYTPTANNGYINDTSANVAVTVHDPDTTATNINVTVSGIIGGNCTQNLGTGGSGQVTINCPISQGTSNLSVSATDSNGGSWAGKSLGTIIVEPFTVTVSPVPGGGAITQNTAFSLTFSPTLQQTGISVQYQWSKSPQTTCSGQGVTTYSGNPLLAPPIGSTVWLNVCAQDGTTPIFNSFGPYNVIANDTTPPVVCVRVYNASNAAYIGEDCSQGGIIKSGTPAIPNTINIGGPITVHVVAYDAGASASGLSYTVQGNGSTCLGQQTAEGDFFSPTPGVTTGPGTFTDSHSGQTVCASHVESSNNANPPTDSESGVVTDYFTYEGIDTAGTYSFTGSAVDNAGNSAQEGISFTLQVPNYTPGAISNKNIGTTSITYTFAKAPNTPPNGYQIFDNTAGQSVSGVPQSESSICSGGSCTLTANFPFANYDANVTIRGCANATCTPPANGPTSTDWTNANAPTNLSATAASAQSADMNWTTAQNSAGTDYKFTFQICPIGSCPLPTQQTVNNFNYVCNGTGCPSAGPTGDVQATPSGGQFNNVATGSTFLSPNTQYRLALSAIRGDGVISINALSFANSTFWTPPMPPQSVGPAKTNGTTEIDVSFVPPANPPSGQTYYIVYGPHGSTPSTVFPGDFASSPAAITNLNPGTEYDFIACTHSNNAADSPTGACTTTTATGWTQFNPPSVTWNKTSTTDQLLGLNVTVSGTPGCAQVNYSGPGSPAGISASNGTTSLTIPGQPNTLYNGITVTVGGASCSDASAATSNPSINAATLPTAPGSPSITPASPTSVQVSFSPSTNGQQYYVKMLDSTGQTVLDRTLPPSFSTSITVPGISPGNTYQFEACTYAQDSTDFSPFTLTPPVETFACSPPQQYSTQFAQPGQVIPLVDATFGATLANSGAFAICIPNNSAAQQPGAANIQWTSNAGSGSQVVDFTNSAVCSAASSPCSGFNCTVSVVGVQGMGSIYSNVAYNSITAQFMKTAQTSVTDPSTSFPSSPATSPAFTKAAAAQITNVTLPDTNNKITVSYSPSPNNVAGTIDHLQILQDDPIGSGTFNWTNQNDIVQDIPVTTPGSVSATLSPGPNYQVRIESLRLAASLPPGTGPQQPSPLGNGFDAASSPAVPGAVLALAPQVSINQNNATGTSFSVHITPNPADTPVKANISYQNYADNTISSTIPFTMDGTGSPMDFTVSPAGEISNSSYTVQAQVRDSNPSSWSEWIQANNNPAWILPQAPGQAFSSVNTTVNSISVLAINFPNNSAGTQYSIQAVVAGSNGVTDPTSAQAFFSGFANQNPATSLCLQSGVFCTSPFTATQTIPILNTPGTAGQTYFVRTYVTSFFQSPQGDAATAPEAVTETPPTAHGHFLSATANSIAAYWDGVDFTPENALLASATDFSGAVATQTIVNGPFAPGPTPTITVSGSLLISNTFYTLSLQKQDVSNGPFTPYLSSQVPGLTYTTAATPTTPNANLGGSKTNVLLFISLPAPGLGNSNPDGNASDSSYAIEITSNSQSGYLDGNGNLIPSPLNSLPSSAFRTLSNWQTSPATTTLNNAGLQNNFQISLCVQQVSPSAVVCSSPLQIGSPGAPIGFNPPVINGALLDLYNFGVSQSASFTAGFTTDMAPGTVSSISLMDLATGQPVPIQVQFIPPGTSSFTVTPTGTLQANHAYELNIPSGLQDNFGFTTTQSFTQNLFTVPDPSQTSTISSPYDTAKTDFVTLPAQSVTPGWFVVTRPQADLKVPPNYVGTSESTVQSALGANQALVSLNQAQVLFFSPNPNGPPIPNDPPTNQGISLTMSIRSSGAAGTPSQTNGVDSNTLGIYLLITNNGSPRLQLVPGSQQNNGSSVTAFITKSGVYVLAGAVTTDLGSSYAWPVPFKPSSGHTVINFSGLAADSTIKVYTIMGELVKQLHNDNNETNLQWDVKNSDGDNVASGVYIYQIKNAFSEKRGKLIIIR